MGEESKVGFEERRTAFDHPLVKPSGGSLAVGADRVLVPKDCRCPKCVERLARYAKTHPATAERIPR